MKIETRKIELGIYHLETKGKGKIISSPKGKNRHLINPNQEQMLLSIAKGKTLESIALESIEQKKPFSFRELYQLIEFLLELEVITDVIFRNYFDPAEHHLILDKNTRVAPTASESLIGKWSVQHLEELPFFAISLQTC